VSRAPATFLDSIPSIEHCAQHYCLCPRSQTAVMHPVGEAFDLYLSVRCKSWTCDVCRRWLMRRLMLRMVDARPNRLVTLTVNPRCWPDPRAAYDGTRRKVAILARMARREFGEFEYLRVLEQTRAGWPHYHLVVRSPYIPQQWLSDRWRELTGAPIVDIRRVDDCDGAASYVAKYLAKQEHCEFTQRRLAWSRGFFPAAADPPQGGGTWQFLGRSACHPCMALASTGHSGGVIVWYARGLTPDAYGEVWDVLRRRWEQ